MTELAPAHGWQHAPAHRIPVPATNEQGLVFRLLSRLSRRLGRQDVPDIITVLHLNPRLFWAWLFFASRLMPYGRLPGRLREMIILRTAWNCRSRYEWGQHVDIALSAGVTELDILAVTQGPGSFEGRDEQALIRACDEIHSNQFISDETWAALSGTYRQHMLIEIMMLIGHYIMIAAFLNSTGLRLEPVIESRLQEFNSRVLPLTP